VLREGDNIEDLGTGGRIILKMILNLITGLGVDSFG
jgi:hypothetical protein